MAFPVIASTSSGSSGFGATSHTTTFPSGVAADNLLILLFERGNAGTTTWPAGWTLLTSDTTNNYALEARYRVYQAGDTAPTLTTTATISAYRMLRITGADTTTAPEATTLTVGTSTTPNPASLDPSAWAAEDTLWIAVCTNGGTAAPSAYPASYSGGTSNSNSFGGAVAYATRNLNATSDDPGTFTLTTSVAWSAATIAVRPVPAAQGSVNLAAAASLTAFAALPVSSATFTASSSLSAAAALPRATVTMSVGTAVSANAGLPVSRATLAATALLSTSMTYIVVTAATFPAQAFLVGVSTPPTTMVATSALVTSGLLLPAVAGATLAASSNLTVTVFLALPVSATLAAVAGLAGTLFTTWPGLTTMIAGTQLVAGVTLPGAIAVLSAQSAIGVTGPYLVTGGSDLVRIVAVATLIATAITFTPVLVQPTGQPMHPLVLPQYRLYAADTRTGRIGWELPVATMSWNTPINDAGSFRGKLVIEETLSALHQQGALDPRNTFREVLGGPYRLSLVLAWGNSVVFAGPYLPSSIPGDQPTVDIGAGELLRLLGKRVLINTAASYPSDPAANITLGPMSQSALVKAIIDAATTGTGRGLPITCSDPPAAQGMETRTYYGFDLNRTLDVLTNLTSEEGSPDYRLDPYLREGDDGLYVAWELRIGEPYLGDRISPWVFDDTAAIISQDIDASRMASTYFVPGTGQDELKLVGTWTDTALIAQGFPALDEIDGSYTSEIDQGRLTSYARANIQRYLAPVDKWSLRVQADSEPGLGTYRVGDSMLIDIQRHPVIVPGTYARRITEISGDSTSWVSISSAEEAVITWNLDAP